MDEWLPRKRGEACRVCRALCCYGPELEEDKAAHEQWHLWLETTVGELVRAQRAPYRSIETLDTEVMS